MEEQCGLITECDNGGLETMAEAESVDHVSMPVEVGTEEGRGK
jgi:hypothetical protein